MQTIEESPNGIQPTPPAVEKPASSDSWALLASLRFVLAFIVVCAHTSRWFIGLNDWTAFGHWLNETDCVYAFFLISGYSIFASLERSEKSYYLRRAQRIWPQYLATLLIGLGVLIAVGFSYTTPNGTHFPAPT